MSRIKEIKNRIKSVKDVQQITKAMKMVAAARLRKIEAKFNFAKAFEGKVKNELSFIYNKNRSVKPFLMKSNESFKKGFLILSGDKGLCGAFNMNVFKKAISAINETGVDNSTVLSVGKKGGLMLKRQNINLFLDVQGIFGKVCYKDAYDISQKIIELYQKNEFVELNIVLNRYKSKDEPVQIIPILPFSIEENEFEDSDYHYDSSEETLLNNLLLYYLSLKIYYYLIESESAEFLARMTAMDSASDNAADLIAKLSLEYNRARQASITKEILDIVGGAEALK